MGTHKIGPPTKPKRRKLGPPKCMSSLVNWPHENYGPKAIYQHFQPRLIEGEGSMHIHLCIN
jgi:hypothetical protein